jgi:hypothetical protein
MFHEVNLSVMDAVTRIRLLFGAARPFVIGKAKDAVRRRLAIRQARKILPTPTSDTMRLRSGLRPLPSAAWLAKHQQDVVDLALHMSRGEMQAYGVETWYMDGSGDVVEERGRLEVARMHQWPAYALASGGDGAVWRERLVEEIETFHDRNPPLRGPYWDVAMDVGIRVHNMLLAVDWLMQLHQEFGESEFGETFKRRVTAMAVDHAVAIDAMLETAGGMSTSHLLGDLLGLIAVSAYVDGDAEIAERGRRAQERLMGELHRQVLNDGMSFEASTAYHRHVVDILLNIYACSPWPDMPAVHGLTPVDLLGLMVQRLRQLEAADMPLIGDNDDGMAVKLTSMHADTSYTFDLANSLQQLPAGAPQGSTAGHIGLDAFGLDIYRRNNVVLTARCGPIGQHGKGGHAHNDQNAITLSIDGVPYIVDPGSSFYSDVAARNHDRSVRSHATVVVDDDEQNLFPEGGGEALWWMMGDRTRGSVITRSKSVWEGAIQCVRGEHRRTIQIHDTLTIVDRIPVGSHGRCLIPVGPDINIEVRGNEARLHGRKGTCLISWDRAGKVTVIKNGIRYAEHFAEPESADVLSITMSGSVLTWTITLPE